MPDLRVIDLDGPDLRERLVAKLRWLTWLTDLPVPGVLADAVLAILRDTGTPTAAANAFPTDTDVWAGLRALMERP